MLYITWKLMISFVNSVREQKMINGYVQSTDNNLWSKMFNLCFCFIESHQIWYSWIQGQNTNEYEHIPFKTTMGCL